MREIKKFFNYLKAKKILFTGIFIYIILSFLSYKIEDMDLDENDQKMLENYYQFLEGPSDEEKIEFLNNENREIELVDKLLEENKRSFFNKEITLEEYEKEIIERKRTFQKRKVFQLVYED